MRLFFVSILILFSTLANFAQTQDTIYLWPDKVPGEDGAKHPPVQMPNTKGNVIRLTDVNNPALIIFEPEASINNGVGVIVCPGGGYNILAIDKEGYEVAGWLNKLGFTAFVLQYRVPNKQKEALYDIQRAIRLIRNRAAAWKIYPYKLGVLGFSAGGSLCARAATNFTKETYTKIDCIDSISCRPDFALLIYPAYLDKGENRSLTPELFVDNNTPPMFIFATSDDYYGNSSLVMATALRDNKVPVELHLLPHGGHGYGLRPGNIAAETWPLFAETWLKKILPVLKIGLVADPQYSDKPTKGERHYKESLRKLNEAIDTFNYNNIDFVQNLGDIIDDGWSGFDSILPIYQRLNSNINNYHLLGNHDFSIDSTHFTDLLETLSMPDYYYSYVKKDWRFIVLDATGYSFFANPLHRRDNNEVNVYYNNIIGKPNHHRWNGAIGKEQQNWLKQELDSAKSLGQKVIVFSHLPVRPLNNSHNLWNDYEIINIIEKYSHVKVFINGHNHSGNYIFKNGIHYITIKGMVNTMLSSYGILEIYNNRIQLKGYGNQESILINFTKE